MGKFYRASLCGENVFLNVDEVGRYGFFVNVIVYDESECAASKSAIESTRNRLLNCSKVDNRFLDVIELTVENIVVCSDPDCQEQGFVWYRDDKPIC